MKMEKVKHTLTHTHTHTHDPFVSTRIEPEQAITLLPDVEKKLISDIVKKGVVKTDHSTWRDQIRACTNLYTASDFDKFMLTLESRCIRVMG